MASQARQLDFKWQEFDIHLVDRFYRNEEGNLAGATISMAEAVRNAVLHLNASLHEVIQMATNRVASAINMDGVVGKIQPGFHATFVQFNNNLTQIETLVL